MNPGKDDAMRTHLVTKFICAKCGNSVKLSYEEPKVDSFDREVVNDRITGAAKVDQSVYLHPCQKCYGEATAPIEALRQVLGVIKI